MIDYRWDLISKENGNIKNIRKIHPMQQGDVSNLVRKLMEFNKVRRIVIFGSSVSIRCSPISDIDMYCELSEALTFEERTAVNDVDIGVDLDLWTNYTVDDGLMREIKENGVVVYDRGA